MTTARGWYFCLKCGGELPGDARFCPLCGHATRAAISPRQAVVPTIVVANEELPLASFGKRFGALLIDWLILAAVTYALMVVFFVVAVVVAFEPDPADAGPQISNRWFAGTFGVASVLSMMAQWAFDTFGWSPGKAATSIRVIRLDGRRPGIVHGLVRYSMRTFSAVVFLLGYLWPLWDVRQQTWHDKLAGTVVVRAQPLQERIVERRPHPLVTRVRVWWLAVLGTAILTGSVALNVFLVATTDGYLFDPQYYGPYYQDEGQRIERIDPPGGVGVLVHLDRWNEAAGD